MFTVKELIFNQLRNYPGHNGIAGCWTSLYAYFYVDFRDTHKQHCHNLFPSLLTQLSARSDSYCETLSHVHMSHDDGARKPSTSTLIACLKKILVLPSQGQIHFDALDESPNIIGIPSARKQVLDLLKNLVDLQLPNLHNQVEDSFPLAIYAGQHWAEHAQFENVSLRMKDGTWHIFDTAKPHFAAWLRLHDIDNGWFTFYLVTKSHASPLYSASLCSFRDLAAHIIVEHPDR
jgi:hypothetical protein